MPLLEVDHVDVFYGDFQAISGVSLSLAAGEVLALIGANGAGKTTLLRAVTGLLAPRAGRIRFDGDDVTGLPAEALARRGIAMVPEGRMLFPSLTVRENLKLGYDAASCKTPFEARLEVIYDLFPRVKERIGQQARTMSGGEQAMVALARALIGDPELLVMDEPSLGLSPKLIDEYFETVARIHAEGRTVLLIEQNAEKALSIADRGYLLVRGQIAVEGTREQMLRDDTIKHMYL